ncbi:MFS transporter [Alsobacter sp. R-9]
MTTAVKSNWEVFRFPGFRRFFSARFMTGVAMQVHNVGLGWLVYDRTGSALALGFVGLAAFLPALLLALVAGVVADRYDRRLIVTTCWSVIAVADVGLLYFATHPETPVWPIFGLTMLVGACRSFGNPATQALLPNLVPRTHFPAAVTFNASAWQSSSILGPAVGGFLYALGPGVVFSVSAAAFAIGATLIGSLKVRHHPPATREPPTLATLFAGVSFIRSRPAILGAISLDLFAVLLGGAVALLPIYAKDILQVGPWGLGLLRSMPATGAIAMTMLMAWFPLRRKAGMRMFMAVAIFGIAIIVFGLSTNLYLSMAALFVTGAADMVSVVVRQTLVQLETPDDMRGRVSAVNSVFIGASNELGEFESGLAAAAFGPVAAVVLGGVGTLLVVATWMKLFPELRRRDALIR